MAYGRKFIKRGARRVKKRYYGKRKGVKVNTLARDVYKIKRMLNTEHKHFDFKFGSGQTVAAQVPTKSHPVILALPMPYRGTSYNERVGNQFKIVHMTMKIQFLFHNNNDLFQRSTGRVRLIFSKSADDVPDITKLLEPDANNHYTNLSFVNGQEYKKYTWIKKCDITQSHTEPINRTDLSTDNLATYVRVAKCRSNVTVMFKNLTEDIEQMKPYLVLTSNMIGQAGVTTLVDPISVSGQIRFTYVDN